VDRFNFGWLRSYTYADAQPPYCRRERFFTSSRGTTIPPATRTYDSTNWIGWGNRTIDDMAHMWLN
jgi:hypothetical protein